MKKQLLCHPRGGFNDTLVTMFPNNLLSGLFEATAQTTEEAVVNVMVTAKTMVGINGARVPELPEETLAEIMSAHAASQ